MQTSYWITNPNAEEEGFYYFQKEFILEEIPNKFLVRISGETRYKLFINGSAVSNGPLKGNGITTYYEEVDLAPYLHCGKNVAQAQVLFLKEDRYLTSVARTGRLAFLLDGGGISTDETWLTAKDRQRSLLPPSYSFFAGLNEKVDFRAPQGEWQKVSVLMPARLDQGSCNPYGEFTPWILEKRCIPPLEIKPSKALEFISPDEDFPLTVKAGESRFLILDAGCLSTAYLKAEFQGGEGSMIKLTYGESFTFEDHGKQVKKARDDSNGTILGDFDQFWLSGRNDTFCSYWFRTFRYIRMDIEAEQDCVVRSISFQQTNYPLEEPEPFHSSDQVLDRMYAVSIRTLKNCMHETYEDCPYYEQLQYTMDTRLEILYHAQLSADCRLAQKAIADFYASRLPNGLILCRAPSVIKQVIPGFCLHWIFMLRDYDTYFGDRQFLGKYLNAVDDILSWFDTKIGEDGLVGPTGYWPFVDWVEGWKDGVPPQGKNGGIVVYSFMLAKALEDAAYLAGEWGDFRRKQEYETRRQRLLDALEVQCFDQQEGLYSDGNTFSTHTQIWAVLAGAKQGQQAKQLLLRAMQMKIPFPSYSMLFYYFRALELTGLYDETNRVLDRWRILLKLGCTTWPEDDVNGRSECHGWSASPIYELSACVLGVRPQGPGYRGILVKPHLWDLTEASGNVATIHGPVKVSWTRQGNSFSITVEGPAGIPKCIVLPNGENIQTTDTSIQKTCKM